MNKKSSVLIMGIFFVFFVSTMTLYTVQTLDKIDSDDFAGDDAIYLQLLETASEKQRFFLELEGEKILDSLEPEFYVNLISTKGKDGFVLIDEYEDLELLAYNWLNVQFNLEMKESILNYSRLVGYEDNIYPNYFNDPNINRSLYAKGDYVYAIALRTQEVHLTSGSMNKYFYWPHLTMKDDFFKNLHLPYDAKFIFEKCYALRGDVESCKSEVQTRFIDHTINAELETTSLLPSGAVADTLVQDTRGDLIVKIETNGISHYESSEDLGKTWTVDIDSDVFITNPALYDKYLSDGTFKQYVLSGNQEVLKFYFDNFLFLLDE